MISFTQKIRSITKSRDFHIIQLIIDITAISYFLYETFSDNIIPVLNITILTVLIAEYLILLIGSKNKIKFFVHPFAIIKLIVIVSFAPTFRYEIGFIRALRMLHIFSLYSKTKVISGGSSFFKKHHNTIIHFAQFVIFVFLISGAIYSFQNETNPNINNFTDAFYYTITTVTTTGFGDITPVTTAERSVSILIMILGITLFFRLANSIARGGNKRYKECKACGLVHHDRDATHCKHCGSIIHIQHSEQL